MKKIEISNEIKNEIIKKFENGVTMHKIVEEYPYCFTIIQKIIKSNDWENKIDNIYPIKDGFELVAVCKTTNKEFIDYKNTSGAIAKHIFNLYPTEKTKSKFIRKSEEYKTNKFWYDKYFDFIYRIPEVVEIKKCFYCDWTTKDINNLAGSYENHLQLIHNKTPQEYLIDNSADKDYFKHIKPEPSKDAVTCKICGQKLNKINNIHLMKHKISVGDYKLNYGGIMFSDSVKERMRIVWDERLKDSDFKRSSSYEVIIAEKLSEINFKLNDRKILNGLEIDLLSVENKIGIEIDGIFYHSEIGGRKDKNYHLNKTLLANKNGINLIHIFEDEIKNKEEIVINKLKHIFGVDKSIKIHGRKCNIIEINDKTKKDFCEKYHIQGNASSTHNIGAEYNNELIAVMLFNNKRSMNKELQHDEDTFELTRFVTKSEYLINGIASKMLNYFISKFKPKKIVSFADRRWTFSSDDNLYTKIGFKLVKTLPPDYSYTNNKIGRYQRFHKFGFGKSSLRKHHPDIYDDNKTEWQMMQELGYDRIWDCGKYKYELPILQGSTIF